jgi:excinuclease UvrABC ATPase subunit
MEGRPCPVCRGKRLNPELLAVTFAGIDIEYTSLLIIIFLSG